MAQRPNLDGYRLFANFGGCPDAENRDETRRRFVQPMRRSSHTINRAAGTDRQPGLVSRGKGGVA
jgi:hypothetical protein